MVPFLLTLWAICRHYSYTFPYWHMGFPHVRWGWGRAGLCWGDGQWGHAMPQSRHSYFSIVELMAFVTVSWGYSDVHWDWPLLSLAAAFPTSGNTEKPVNCWNGSCGDFVEKIFWNERCGTSSPPSTFQTCFSLSASPCSCHVTGKTAF